MREVRRFLADTFAMVAFSFLAGGFVKLEISGLTLDQTLKIRAAAIPVSILIGRPYGLYGDFLLHILTRVHDNHHVNKFLVDTFANLTFQVPLYALILSFNGATHAQIISAAGSIVLISSISGRPYGLFLNICRRLFSVPIA